MYLMIGNDEYYIECTYEYIRGSKGAWCDGVQVDPDEPSSVEISKVMIDFSEATGGQDMAEITLPPPVISELEYEILQEHEA